MAYTLEQLVAAAGDALGDVRVRTGALTPDGARLALSDGREAMLRLYHRPDPPELAALRMLAPEIDLPVPQILAQVTGNSPLGSPFAVLSQPAGQPLPEALPSLSENQRYELGQRLGTVLARVHRLAAPRYGALSDDDPLAARTDAVYTAARARMALDAGLIDGELDAELAAQLETWLRSALIDKGRQPALVHGALRPEHVLVSRRSSGWELSGLVGWSAAQGWSPGWDHSVLLDAAGERDYFGVRVGYGNAYDELNERTYEQVREAALAPYRLVLYAERLLATGDPAGRARYRARLRSLVAGSPPATLPVETA